MNLFIDLHQHLIKKLVDAKVDFIVIGGYSVIFHGYKRSTGDIDIWLKPENENKLRFLPVLADFGFDDSDLAHVAAMDFTKHMVFSIGEPPEKMILSPISILLVSTMRINRKYMQTLKG